MIKVREDRENKTTFISIDDATPRVRRGLKTALHNIGRENTRFCRQLIRKPPKTGRVYTIGGSRHQASAPGEAPANQSGELARKIGFRVSGWSFMKFGDRAKHGKFLENGTRNMEKRPHLSTTVSEKSRDNYNEIAIQTGLEINKK